ncbi:MAG: glycosyltransferase family 39 protein [PVC group bacterium]
MLKKIKKAVWYTGLISTVIISAGFSIFAYHYLLKPQGTFGWDESHRASYGIIVAHAVKTGNWGTFWSVTNRQIVGWPFFHSWVVASGLLLFGFTFIGARLSSLVLFFLSVPLVYLIATELNGKKSILTGIIAAFFYASSPLILYYSTVAMIELLGLFLTLLVAYLYFRAWESRSSVCYLLVGFFTAVLFLSKYQYGLFMLLSLLVDSFLRWLKLGKNALKSPALILVAFVVVIVIWLFGSIPVLKIKAFIHTLKESGGHVPSLNFTPTDRRLFYLRSFASYYPAGILAFLVIIPGFIYSVYKLLKSHLRFLFVYPVVNISLISISINTQDRYCILSMPFLFILGAFFLVEAGAWFKKKSSRLIYSALVLTVFIGDIYKFPLYYRQVPNRLHSGGGRVGWMENKIDYSFFYNLFKLPTFLQQPAFYLNPEADYAAPKHNWQDVWEYIYRVIDKRGPLCCLTYHQRFSPHMLHWFSYAYDVPVFTSWEPRCRFFATLIIDPLSVYYTEEGKRMAESRNKDWSLFLNDLERKGLIKLVAQRNFSDIKVLVKVFERRDED